MQTSAPTSRRKPDWWVYATVVLAALQCVLFLVPQARPGRVGVFLWLFGLGIVPLVAVALLIVGLVWSVVRRPFWTRWRLAGYLGLLVLAISGMAFRTYPSSHDRSPSNVRFRLPLDGPVTVGWGGPTPDVNYHVMAPDQRWAYDLLVTRDGKSFQRDGKNVEDYYSYGRPVVAPADGTIVAAWDRDPDMPVGQLGGGTTPTGNHVVIEVAPREFVFICHLRHGSIPVKVGDRVVAGQELGRVGNSGNTSEPHVHIHLQDTPTLVLGEGIPLYFHGYRRDGQIVERGIPTGGVSGAKFAGQIVEHVSPPPAKPPNP